MQSIRISINIKPPLPLVSINPMDVDMSDLEDDLEHEEFSVSSVEVSSGDESNFGSDDEEDDEEVSCEQIKKHKREHHIGDSPISLERAISCFNTGTNIDQDLAIKNVIAYLERMSSHPPSLLSSFINKVESLHDNDERLIWYIVINYLLMCQ